MSTSKNNEKSASTGMENAFSATDVNNNIDDGNIKNPGSQERACNYRTDEDKIRAEFSDFTEPDPEEPKNSKDIRSKYWCFILYPESALSDWKSCLCMSGMPWAISPLHDSDLNPDGSKKKPHYHVIVVWSNSTTYSAAKKFTHETLHGTVPQVLHTPVGYYRYFTHQDNPEKYQYNEKDVLSGNGFDISDYSKMTKRQKVEMHMSISNMIMSEEISTYAEAVKRCMSLGFEEYDMLTSHTIHYMNLCKSVAYSIREESEF